MSSRSYRDDDSDDSIDGLPSSRGSGRALEALESDGSDKIMEASVPVLSSLEKASSRPTSRLSTAPRPDSRTSQASKGSRASGGSASRRPPPELSSSETETDTEESESQSEPDFTEKRYDAPVDVEMGLAPKTKSKQKQAAKPVKRDWLMRSLPVSGASSSVASSVSAPLKKAPSSSKSKGYAPVPGDTGSAVSMASKSSTSTPPPSKQSCMSKMKWWAWLLIAVAILLILLGIYYGTHESDSSDEASSNHSSDNTTISTDDGFGNVSTGTNSLNFTGTLTGSDDYDFGTVTGSTPSVTHGSTTGSASPSKSGSATQSQSTGAPQQTGGFGNLNLYNSTQQGPVIQSSYQWSQPSTTTSGGYQWSQSSSTPTQSSAQSVPSAPSVNVGTTYQSQATWFESSQHLSQCETVFNDNDLVVALQSEMYGANDTVSQFCGKKLVVYNPVSQLSVEVVVQDNCPLCAKGMGLDLSKSAFSSISPLDNGVIPVIWWWSDSATDALMNGLSGSNTAPTGNEQSLGQMPSAQKSGHHQGSRHGPVVSGSSTSSTSTATSSAGTATTTNSSSGNWLRRRLGRW